MRLSRLAEYDVIRGAPFYSCPSPPTLNPPLHVAHIARWVWDPFFKSKRH